MSGAEELAKNRIAYEALVVEEAINAIGTVTLESDSAITAARKAYDGASAEVQAAVANAGVLSDAETAISGLRAQAVSEMIDAIGTVTLDSGDAIQVARDMLKKLSKEETAKVANADVLKTAVETLKTLKKGRSESLLSNMRKDEDKVQRMTFYYPSAWKFYSNGSWAADQRCFMLPYIGRDANRVWLRLVHNYTDYDWVFFKKVTVAADEERFTERFKYFDVVHDNGGGRVWEYIDVDVCDADSKMLWVVANSQETIIRFEGDDHSYDFTVKDSDKAAIREVLTAYEALK